MATYKCQVNLSKTSAGTIKFEVEAEDEQAAEEAAEKKALNLNTKGKVEMGGRGHQRTEHQRRSRRKRKRKKRIPTNGRNYSPAEIKSASKMTPPAATLPASSSASTTTTRMIITSA